MPLGGAVAPLRIHRGDDGVALDELPRLDIDPMHPQGLGDLLHIGDSGLGRRTAAGAGDPADIGDLSAGLGVERGAVEHDLDPFGWHRFGVHSRMMGHYRNPLAVDEDADDPGLGAELVEAGELGRTRIDQFAESREIRVRVLAGGRVRLGPAALLGHQLTEPQLVHGEPGLRGHFQGELNREPVGVVQGKRLRTAEHGLPGRRSAGGGVLKQPRTRDQGPVEGGLLGHRDPVDPVEVGDQFRVGRTHGVTHAGHQVADDRGVDAQ